jgi:crotonobetainyl-CoA:carnitine CoA-transferase CaiB-like acyl-CoA transferase
LLSHRYACYNTYAAADGSFMAVGALEHRFWSQLCRCLGLEKYVDLQFDEERRGEIIGALGQVFRQKSATQWEQEFLDADVCCTRVLGLEELLQHPLFREREMVVDGSIDGVGGGGTLGISIKLSDTPGSIRTAPAWFGQHNQEILEGLGYSEADITDFTVRNII